MASNIEVTLKRYNGTDEDLIFPTTTMDQVRISTSDATTLSTHLVNTYIPLAQRAAANGVATLDGSGLIPYNQLPSSLTGGLKFVNGLSVNTDLDTLGALYSNSTDAIGSYWIATAEIVLTSAANSVVLAPGDEGDNTFPITIEAGDWIIISSWAANDYEFAIVNNTYQQASTTAYGISRLSSISNLSGAGGNNVITDGIIAGLIGTASGEIAAGDHLHDDRYYTETEVNNFFSGSSSITGYNKANWDAAYNDKINSASFSTSTGVLTLTQQDGGTVTVDLDDRYAENILVGQVNSTAGLTVSKTGNAYTLGHADSSSIGNVANTNGTVLQSMTFDTYGHVLTQSSLNLDTRYYTEAEIDDWIDGSGTINGNTYVPILYGAAPSSSITGAILIDID
jgi:hypothetical protein